MEEYEKKVTARQHVVHDCLYSKRFYVPRPNEPEVVYMLTALLQMHREGTLTEGQVSKFTGLDRIAIRSFVDAIDAAESKKDSIEQAAKEIRYQLKYGTLKKEHVESQIKKLEAAAK